MLNGHVLFDIESEGNENLRMFSLILKFLFFAVLIVYLHFVVKLCYFSFRIFSM